MPVTERFIPLVGNHEQVFLQLRRRHRPAAGLASFDRLESRFATSCLQRYPGDAPACSRTLREDRSAQCPIVQFFVSDGATGIVPYRFGLGGG